MALDARTLRAASVPTAVDTSAARPWSGPGGAAPNAAVPVDVPALWGDEGRMKRELVAWAKAVASMAIRESMQR
ncbi:hypothetical protein SETIT_7G118900v2 [Setaria italica]|uniref:Uncharacterized protein n=2 Tax=Setaria TaxID=4554 RepID=K3YE13_SETIT|nr:hypothetical protein SETIT_7G118900v2 [Setaria italica]TKW04713.1 hypothetical protein SEVIR_7G127100v2 [Setaria viridis]